jgi:hypothetical protein
MELLYLQRLLGGELHRNGVFKLNFQTERLGMEAYSLLEYNICHLDKMEARLARFNAKFLAVYVQFSNVRLSIYSGIPEL